MPSNNNQQHLILPPNFLSPSRPSQPSRPPQLVFPQHYLHQQEEDDYKDLVPIIELGSPTLSIPLKRDYMVNDGVRSTVIDEGHGRRNKCKIKMGKYKDIRYLDIEHEYESQRKCLREKKIIYLEQVLDLKLRRLSEWTRLQVDYINRTGGIFKSLNLRDKCRENKHRIRMPVKNIKKALEIFEFHKMNQNKLKNKTEDEIYNEKIDLMRIIWPGMDADQLSQVSEKTISKDQLIKIDYDNIENGSFILIWKDIPLELLSEMYMTVFEWKRNNSLDRIYTTMTEYYRHLIKNRITNEDKIQNVLRDKNMDTKTMFKLMIVANELTILNYYNNSSKNSNNKDDSNNDNNNE
ncbi:hypothetical protein Glove_130g7 [Diversispora epigaea]|uniref:Uncharacterized protein n=1 Tax=Diversispora epigaea TaxID=1348612 RepID=A0A397J201_9GLOM|nr:hypothetical protein Glove_130g7 [Diversispora epigaea]